MTWKVISSSAAKYHAIQVEINRMGPSLLLVRYLWPLPVLCTWWNLQYFQLSDHRIMTKLLSYYLRLLATLYAFTSKYYCKRFQKWFLIFSTANLSLALFHLTNGLGENTPSHDLNMFNLRLCKATTIRYSLLNFGHIYLCGIDYKYFHHTVVSVIVLAPLPQ